MAFLPSAHALFEDAEARRAILELRQRFDASAQNAQNAPQPARFASANRNLCAAIWPNCVAETEQLAREASEIQRTRKRLGPGVDERLKPVLSRVKCRSMACASSLSRKSAMISRWPWSSFARAILPLHANPLPPLSILTSKAGYLPSARFWLAIRPVRADRDYKNAVQNYRAVVNAGPQHAKSARSGLVWRTANWS